MEKKLLGRWGEEKAADYLRKKKYHILALNYSCRFGEIDIIAEKDGYIVFTEVKLRRSDVFSEAREAVTPAKQRRLLAAAELWMACSGEERRARFDVIEVYTPEGTKSRSPTIRHWENAFM